MPDFNYDDERRDVTDYRAAAKDADFNRAMTSLKLAQDVPAAHARAWANHARALGVSLDAFPLDVIREYSNPTRFA